MLTRIEIQLMMLQAKELPKIRKALERIAEALEKTGEGPEQ